MAHDLGRDFRLSAAVQSILPGLIASLRAVLGEEIYSPFPAALFVGPERCSSHEEAERLIDELVVTRRAERSGKNVQLLSSVYVFETKKVVSTPAPSSQDAKKRHKRQRWDLATILVTFGKNDLLLDDPELEQKVAECKQRLLVIRDLWDLLQLCEEMLGTGLVEKLPDGYRIVPDEDLETKIAARRPPEELILSAEVFIPSDPARHEALLERFYRNGDFELGRWLNMRTDGQSFVVDAALTHNSPVVATDLPRLLESMREIGMLANDAKTSKWSWRHKETPIEYLTDLGDVYDGQGNLLFRWQTFS